LVPLPASRPSGGLSYVLADVQGSMRALMNNSGSGTSTITSRHDYLPFGEEIGASVGLRTTSQKYSQPDNVRRRFAMLERDDVTGLDHTWFRKYEARAGRWTSPDLVGGSLSDPQSFNRYAYVQNDPVNLLDLTGLMPCVPGSTSAECDSSGFGGWGGGFDMNDRRSAIPTAFTDGSRYRSQPPKFFYAVVELYQRVSF
jgi:RHS repeat-associated protein